MLAILFIIFMEIIGATNQNNDFDKFLALARKTRNNAKTSNDFQRTHHLYEIAIQHGEPGKELGTAIFELSQLLVNETYLFRVSINDQRDTGTSSSATQHNHALIKSGVNISYNFNLLVRSASMGHPTAQVYLAAAYASGVYLTLMPMDSTSSILLQYIAALSGNVEANMAMGYRYLYGLGVPESCDLALKHYEFAANHVANSIEEKGHSVFIDYTRLSDSSSVPNRGQGRREFDPEMIDYYQSLADEGDWGAAMTLSTVYSTGSRFVQQDQIKAMKYLNIAVRFDHPPARGILGYYIAAEIGRNMTRAIMELNVAKNAAKKQASDINAHSLDHQSYTLNTTLLEIMKEHLMYASARGDPSAMVGIGYCHMRGIGFKRNLTLAIEYFTKANGKHIDAPWHLANVLMGQSRKDDLFFSQTVRETAAHHLMNDRIPDNIPIDLASAVQLYTQAASQGHPLAIHRLAHMLANGIGVHKSCPNAVSGFKQMAEKGEMVAGLNQAHALMDKGFYDRALMIFARIASFGVESAQHNIAYVLTRKYCPAPFRHSLIPLNVYSIEAPFLSLKKLGGTGDNAVKQTQPHKSNLTRAQECQLRGLYMYTLSARQGNAESYLRVGDSYYYGMGGMTPNKQEAAGFYQLAAEMRHTQAIFNLGMMHEFGDGVEMDFHLAKRFYDQAAQFDINALLPRTVALMALDLHKQLYQILGPDTVSEILVKVQRVLHILVSNIVDIKHKINYYLVHGTNFNHEDSVPEQDDLDYDSIHADTTGELSTYGQPSAFDGSDARSQFVSIILDRFLYCYNSLCTVYKSVEHRVYNSEQLLRELILNVYSRMNEEWLSIINHYQRHVNFQIFVNGRNVQLSERTVQLVVNSSLLIMFSFLWLGIYSYRQQRRRWRLEQLIRQQRQQHLHQE